MARGVEKRGARARQLANEVTKNWEKQQGTPERVPSRRTKNPYQAIMPAKITLLFYQARKSGLDLVQVICLPVQVQPTASGKRGVDWVGLSGKQSPRKTLARLAVQPGKVIAIRLGKFNAEKKRGDTPEQANDRCSRVMKTLSTLI